MRARQLARGYGMGRRAGVPYEPWRGPGAPARAARRGWRYRRTRNASRDAWPKARHKASRKGPLRPPLAAQGHISEAELETHLLDLKNQTENMRLLLESVEAELSEKRAQQGLTEAAHAWLVALRERIAEVEEDTEEAFRARRQLVKLLVQSITVGKRREDGSIEARITSRFGPPSSPPAEAGGESVVPGLKNGSRS